MQQSIKNRIRQMIVYVRMDEIDFVFKSVDIFKEYPSLFKYILENISISVKGKDESTTFRIRPFPLDLYGE